VHVCVLGAGGLGSVIGARLAESGVRVSLVGRSAHVAAIRRKGLRVEGISGERTVCENLHAYEAIDDVPGHIDWLALLVKTRDTASALDTAAVHAARIGGAFSLQNSVTKDRTLAASLGAMRVIGASTTEAGVLLAPGEVRHTATAPAAFYFGELPANREMTGRIDELVAAFTQAGLAARATDCIEQVEWEKLLQISAVAGFCASTLGFMPGASFGHALAVRSGAEHYVQLVTELLAVYRALGYEPQDFYTPFATFRRAATCAFDDAVADAMALGSTMVANGVGGRPSLHEDLLRHRPTELDDCIGEYLRAADRLGVPTPTLRGAHRVISTLEMLTKDAT
jgi:2-dehydropantoate 2-reductase